MTVLFDKRLQADKNDLLNYEMWTINLFMPSEPTYVLIPLRGPLQGMLEFFRVNHRHKVVIEIDKLSNWLINCRSQKGKKIEPVAHEVLIENRNENRLQFSM